MGEVVMLRPVDTAMHRQLFVEMTVPQQEAYLDGIRERRLRSVQVYEQLQQAKRAVKDEATRAKLQKQCNMMDKEIIALNKALEKVEARAVTVTALQQMLNAEVIGQVEHKEEVTEDAEE